MESVSFEQTWKTPNGIDKTFELLSNAFTDSDASEIWPKKLSSLKAQSTPLQKGTLVIANYKLGPFSAKAPYTIQEFSPPKRIVYRADSGHKLIGGAQISLTSISENETMITWKGDYKRKDLSGAISLLWFKWVFEDRFFSDLREKL